MLIARRYNFASREANYREDISVEKGERGFTIIKSAASSQSDRVWIMSGKVIGVCIYIYRALERKAIFPDLKPIVPRRRPRAGDPHAASATATYSWW